MSAGKKDTFFTRHPWLTDMLTRAAMASGVGYLAAAYSISRWLTRPARRPVKLTPDAAGLSWEPLTCRTEDRFRLTGWAIHPSTPAVGNVMLFHGLRNTREQMLSRAEFLARNGYRCIAFDHRAHGESNGKRTSFGYLEGRDVTAVVDLVRQRWPNQPQALLGISMGAAAICFAADSTRHCHAIVLESCYRDIGTAFQNRLRHGYPPWYQKLSRGVIWITERRLGLRLHQLNPSRHIALLTPAPVLVLTGTEDPHAPPTEVQQLYDCCREPRELWLVPNAKHKDVFEVGGQAYQDRILDFLDRRMSQRLAA